LRKILILALFATSTMFAAEGIAKVYDDQVSTIEREVLGLAQKMPADKYSFAPTNGTFTGVRTYAQEVSHLATKVHEDVKNFPIPISDADVNRMIDLMRGPLGVPAILISSFVLSTLLAAFGGAVGAKLLRRN
jgi:hypothetical protein